MKYEKVGRAVLTVVLVFAVSALALGYSSKKTHGAERETQRLSAAKERLPAFDIMKQKFRELGVSEAEMWKLLRSSNTILNDTRGDMQVAYALRQITDPKVDSKTKKDTKEWVVEKINNNEYYVSMSVTDLEDTAWLITAEDPLKAVTLKLSSFSSDLPLDPNGLKAYLDKTGEGGFLGSGSGSGYGGAGGVTPNTGTARPGAGRSLIDCVGSVSFGGKSSGANVEGKSGGGGKPSVTDGSGDSTTTETGGKGGSLEGRPSIGFGGGCGALDVNAMNGGGSVSEGSSQMKSYSFDLITKTYTDKGVVFHEVGFTAEKFTSGGVQGTFTDKTYGRDFKTGAEIPISGGTSAAEFATGPFVYKGEDLNKGLTVGDAYDKAKGDAKGKKTTVDQAGDKVNPPPASDSAGGSDKQGNPLEGSDSAAPCAKAVSACASMPAQFFGANAQLKQLAQDCLNSAGKGGSPDEATGGAVATTEGGGADSGSSFSSPKTPAPGACDKVSPGCMKELSKGPLINPAGEASSCFALSGDALGFSKQMMVTDPVEYMGNAAAQTGKKANTSAFQGAPKQDMKATMKGQAAKSQSAQSSSTNSAQQKNSKSSATPAARAMPAGGATPLPSQ